MVKLQIFSDNRDADFAQKQSKQETSRPADIGGLGRKEIMDLFRLIHMFRYLGLRILPIVNLTTITLLSTLNQSNEIPL